MSRYPWKSGKSGCGLDVTATLSPGVMCYLHLKALFGKESTKACTDVVQVMNLNDLL